MFLSFEFEKPLKVFISIFLNNVFVTSPNVQIQILQHLYTLKHTHTHTHTESLQGGRGHWTVYYTSPQSFIINFFLFVGFTTFGAFIEFWFVGVLSWVSKRLTSWFNFTEGFVFVFHHWGCTSIYLPLSCPFRSLESLT